MKSDVPSQKMRVLKYITDFDGITRAEALTQLGISNLPAVINELRNLNYEIDTETVNDKNRYGQSVTYARYVFHKEKANEY